MNRFKLGLVLEGLGLPLRRALPEAAKLGAECFRVDAVGDLAPERLSDTGRRELLALLRSYRLEISELNLPLRKGMDDPEDLQPRLDQIRKVMKLAYELGAKRVVLPLPSVGGYQGEKPSTPKVDVTPSGLILPSSDLPLSSMILGLTAKAAPSESVFRESLRDLVAYGERVGTTLALQAGLEDGPTVAAYLSTYPTGNWGIDFDPANFLINGHDPLAALTLLSKNIITFRARDARKPSVSGGRQEAAVGAGEVDWISIFATLEAMDCRGTLVVDRQEGNRRAADIASGIQFLRRFLTPVEG